MQNAPVIAIITNKNAVGLLHPAVEPIPHGLILPIGNKRDLPNVLTAPVLHHPQPFLRVKPIQQAFPAVRVRLPDQPAPAHAAHGEVGNRIRIQRAQPHALNPRAAPPIRDARHAPLAQHVVRPIHAQQPVQQLLRALQQINLRRSVLRRVLTQVERPRVRIIQSLLHDPAPLFARFLLILLVERGAEHRPPLVRQHVQQLFIGLSAVLNGDDLAGVWHIVDVRQLVI